MDIDKIKQQLDRPFAAHETWWHRMAQEMIGRIEALEEIIEDIDLWRPDIEEGWDDDNYLTTVVVTTEFGVFEADCLERAMLMAIKCDDESDCDMPNDGEMVV